MVVKRSEYRVICISMRFIKKLYQELYTFAMWMDWIEIMFFEYNYGYLVGKICLKQDI